MKQRVQQLLAVAIVVQLAVAGGVVATRSPAPQTGTLIGAALPSGGPEQATSSSQPRVAPSVYEQRRSEIAALLRRRAAAVLVRDRSGFTAGLDPMQRGFKRSQLAVFDNLREVPLATWDYTVDGTDQADDIPELARKYKAAEVYAPGVRLRYRLRGFDRHPNELVQHFTFVRRGGRWLIAGDTDFDRPGRRTARDLWDYGRVHTTRGKRSLILGLGNRPQFFASLARETDDAVPRVSAVWGKDWSRRVVVLVPQSQKQLSSMVGDAASLSQIAAVAVGQLEEHADGYRSGGNRVIVNPPNFNQLGSLGRRIVLTHEVTHVATRDASGSRVPAWLAEGLADYVGYLGTGVSIESGARELRDDVRRGRVPKTLPTDEDFHGDNKRLPQAYEGAWLACRMIVERTSQKRLIAFYRALGRERSGSDEEALRKVMRAELNTTPESFTRAWRAYLKKQLA